MLNLLFLSTERFSPESSIAPHLFAGDGASADMRQTASCLIFEPRPTVCQMLGRVALFFHPGHQWGFWVFH